MGRREQRLGRPRACTLRTLSGSRDALVQRPWAGSSWTLPPGWIHRREVSACHFAGASRPLVHSTVSAYSFVKWSRCLIHCTNPGEPGVANIFQRVLSSPTLCNEPKTLSWGPCWYCSWRAQDWQIVTLLSYLTGSLLLVNPPNHLQNGSQLMALMLGQLKRESLEISERESRTWLDLLLLLDGQFEGRVRFNVPW